MNVSRTALLFPEARYEPQIATRLNTVLTACCLAAKSRATGNHKMGYGLSLTHENNGFTIDEVMDNLTGYTIWQVIATIRELATEDYVNDIYSSMEVIVITDNLFSAIAEEWAYAMGIRPYRIDSAKIYAPTQRVAEIIYRRRLDRLTRLTQQ